MKKKLICLFLVLAMATSIFATVATASQRHDNLLLLEEAAVDAGITVVELLAVEAEVDAIYGENFSANQREAILQIESINAGFSRSRDGSVIYPDFYAGSGLYNDGSLLLLIVESELENAYRHDVIGSLLENGARYVLVDYSHADLLEVLGAVNDVVYEQRAVLRSNCIYSLNVSAISIDPRMNRVVVGIVEYNYSMISGFRRHLYDSPMLVFEQMGVIELGGDHSTYNFCYDSISGIFDNDDWGHSYYHNAETEISPANLTWANPGERVSRPPLLGNYGTIGFRVHCQDKRLTGFLTTGSVFNNGDNLILGSVGITTIGTVYSRRFFYNVPNGINAAFVTYTGSLRVTNTFPNGRNINLSVTNPQFGMPLYAFGSRTGHMVNGAVNRTNFYFYNGHRRFNNMTQVTGIGGSARSQSGDSGGAVITAQGNSVGLIAGGDQSQFIVVPLSRILDDFRRTGYSLQRR